MNDDAIAAVIAERARSACLTVGVAESLSSGVVASILGAAPGAADWFRGGIVAYATEVKQQLLGVDPGPVVSPECASQMATGAGQALGADIVVATTGAGGPEPQDGQPVGTVFIAVTTPDATQATEHHFEGNPSEVVAQTVTAALSELLLAVNESETRP